MARIDISSAGENFSVDYTFPVPLSGPGPDVMPGPSNTGVPVGVPLTRRDGDIVITVAGTVLEGLDIYGNVLVKAKGVTIRNCRVRGGVPGTQAGVVMCAGAGYSLLIEDTEIYAERQSYQVNGLWGYNITARRLNIHDVIDPCHFYGTGNVRLEDSWLHDNLHYENDPGWNGGPSHDDSIQIQSGSGYWILRNRIEGANNAGIMVTQDAGLTSNIMIRDNYLDGGGCTVNLHDKGKGAFVNIDILDNLFGPGSVYNCNVIRTVGDITIAGNARTDGRALKVNTHA